jgi:hypothetical protein
MKKTNMIICLEKLCRDLSIVVKYDKFFGRGGFCRLRDQSYFIINERLSNDAKEQLFVDGLKAYDFAAAQIPLQLQDILNTSNENNSNPV